MQDAFRSYFGAEWSEVLHTADRSLAYNAANASYFGVRGLLPVEDLTLERLLERKGSGRTVNIIAS